NNPLNAGTALPVPSAAGNNAVPRSIARIKYDGTVETIAFTATGVNATGVETGGNFNGVYSPDGNQFYLSGFNGAYYSSSFIPAEVLQTQTLLTNINYPTVGLQMAGGNLYAVGTRYTTPATANLIGQFQGLPIVANAVSISAASESSTTATITIPAA